ncbi:molybdenum ABC transporter ATP-binding protein [Xanthobacter sp. TB0139]|uniref:molybdenum ABC transporter ATP-binding protein n=1 Tax=Xanthobacter sp. TB0139 TaxID=3459178 RepID=UPI0040392E4B
MIEIDIALKRGTGFSLSAQIMVPGSGITALFGRSGSGKTTIIQSVAGTVQPDHGRIQVGEEVFLDAARGINLPIEKRRVGYVFQDSRLFPHMSVNSNLRYGLRRARGRAFISFDTVVELLGIGHLLKRRPHTLSGGEKQRVAIGRALLSQPRILLMDEPLASLDEMRKREILPYLERLRDDLKLPILYVSHSIEEVVRLSDTVVMVHEGAIVASGPLADVLTRPEALPVVGRFDLGSVFECQVAEHDPEMALSTLRFPEGELRVPQVDLPVGAAARARIRARDVSLALSRPMDVSITNRLPGIIYALRREEGPYVNVEMGLGKDGKGSRLQALVTIESVARLALAPGMTVWAMIKTVAVDNRSRHFAPRSEPLAGLPSRPERAPPALHLVPTTRKEQP